MRFFCCQVYIITTKTYAALWTQYYFEYVLKRLRSEIHIKELKV